MDRKVIFESMTPEQQFLVDSFGTDEIYGESGDQTPVGQWLGPAAERGYFGSVDLFGRQGVDQENIVVRKTTPSVDVLRSRLGSSLELEEVL